MCKPLCEILGLIIVVTLQHVVQIDGETGDGNSCCLLSRVAQGIGKKHACTGLFEAGTLCCWVACPTSSTLMLVATSVTVTLQALVEGKTGCCFAGPVGGPHPCSERGRHCTAHPLSSLPAATAQTLCTVSHPQLCKTLNALKDSS